MRILHTPKKFGIFCRLYLLRFRHIMEQLDYTIAILLLISFLLLVLKLSEYIFTILQINPDFDTKNTTSLIRVLSSFEILSLLFLISTNPQNTRFSIQSLENVIQSVMFSKVYESIEMPTNVYQTLITNCRNRQSIQIIRPYVLSALKLVSKTHN